MVNMANLPQGKEFSLEGGVKSIGRGSEKTYPPEHSLVAEILISRGFNGLGSADARQADASKSLLSAKILASGGKDLGGANTKAHSPEKALQAAQTAEMSNIPVRENVR